VLASEALALAYALETGAVDLTEARAWAAIQIGNADAPSNELLDLAVEMKLADAVSQLHALGRGADLSLAGKLAYRHFRQAIAKGTIGHERAAHAIARLAQDSCAPSADAARQAWRFDDAFVLAQQELYGTVAEVKADVEEHLDRFSA